MQTPAHVAEFVRWIQWLNEFALTVGASPQFFVTWLLLPEILGKAFQGLATAIMMGFAGFLLAVAIAVLVITGILVVVFLAVLALCIGLRE